MKVKVLPGKVFISSSDTATAASEGSAVSGLNFAEIGELWFFNFLKKGFFFLTFIASSSSDSEKTSPDSEDSLRAAVSKSGSRSLSFASLSSSDFQ